MGKAQKQRANRIAKQIKQKQEDEDFQRMIASMKDDITYQIRKGNGYLYNGANFYGARWKELFLKPKTEADEN